MSRGKARGPAAPSDVTSGPEVERLYQPKLDRVVLGRLLAFARPYRGRLVAGGLLLLQISARAHAVTHQTRPAIDQHIASGDLGGLGRLSLLYLALLAAVFVVRYLQMTLMQATGQRITTDLRNALFRHLQRLDAGYYEKNPVGRIMTRLTGDIETLNDLFTSGLVSIFGDIITLFGIAGILFWLNPSLALVTLTVVPLLLVVTLLFRARVRAAYALIRVRIAAINAFLQESFTGISLVHLFHRESIHERKFAKLNAGHRDAFLKSVFYYSVYFPVVEILEAAALALILWRGGGAALEQAITLGSLVAFIQYSERFFRPIRDLSERYNILQGAMASSERILDLLDTQPRIVSSESRSTPPHPVASLRANEVPATPGPPTVPAVEFRDVRFSYLPGEEVLKGLSFRVGSGEAVALVGHTGAGKSTIAHLLTRTYDVDAGSILVDGRDLRDWNLNELRRRVGIVPQEVFLWSGGIRLNIALRGGRSEERIEEAIRVAGLSPLIGRLEAGQNRGVGERGAQLSSGERQLVSFARALAADPPVLVLDEATSNVDTETEQQVRAAVIALLRGRTSIVIAHRLSTIRHVQRILVLHRGRLVEEGTHDELLRVGGIYARYFELEYRGQENGSALEA